MRRTIGVLKDGLEVSISDTSPNFHVAILGITGSGKSTRLLEIMKNLVQIGQTVIHIDQEETHIGLPSEITNEIDLLEDGLKMKLLNTRYVENGTESYVNYLAYMTELLAGTHNLGVRQQGVLREAIEYATGHSSEYASDMETIAEALIDSDSSVSTGVYQKLWSVLRSDAFRDNGKCIEPGKINIISMRKMPAGSQKSLVEMILGMIWREVRFHTMADHKITFVLDEFQRLHLAKNSILMELFAQGRKYGINMIVATQSTGFLTPEVRNVIDQANTKLYFKPALAEVKKVAELICHQESERYVLMLKKLKIGEALTVGNLKISGKEFDNPIITRSLYDLKHPKINGSRALLENRI